MLDDKTSKNKGIGFGQMFSGFYFVMFTLATISYGLSFTRYFDDIYIVVMFILFAFTIPPMIYFKWIREEIKGCYSGAKRYLNVRRFALAIVVTMQPVNIFLFYDSNKGAVLSGGVMLFSLLIFYSLFFGRKSERIIWFKFE